MADPLLATLLQLVQVTFATVTFLVVAGILFREGVKGLFTRLIATLRLIPGVDAAISAVLRREVSNFVRQMDSPPAGTRENKDCSKVVCIPEKGVCTRGLHSTYGSSHGWVEQSPAAPRSISDVFFREPSCMLTGLPEK